MSPKNEASERQTHDAQRNLGRQVEAAQRDDESARSAPPPPQPNQDAPAAPQPNQDLEARKRLELLVQRAQRGDEAVLPELKQVLDNHPGLWQIGRAHV